MAAKGRCLDNCVFFIARSEQVLRSLSRKIEPSGFAELAQLPGQKQLCAAYTFPFFFPRDLDSEHVRAFSICATNRLESRRQGGAVNNLKLILYISIWQG
jgi:hypothetical protein